MRSSTTLFRGVAWTSLACAACCAFVVQRQAAPLRLASRQQPSHGVPTTSPLFEATGIWQTTAGERQRLNQHATSPSDERFQHDIVGRYRPPAEQDFLARAYQLRSHRPELRIAALQRIYDLYDPRGPRLVLESLHVDPDASVRLAAAKLLSKRYAENRQVLHAALRNDPSAEVRKGVVRLISSSPETEDRAALFTALRNDPSADVRKEVVNRISLRSDDDSRAVLQSAVADVPAVAVPAFCRLSMTEWPAVADQAWELVGKEMSNQQRLAVIAPLLRIHKRSTVEHAIDLLEQLDDEQPHYAAELRDVIIQSLEKTYRLVHQWPVRPIPQSAGEWRMWWTDVSANLDGQLNWIEDQPDLPHLESDRSQLIFAAKLDGATFRPLDPIRLELSVTNSSQFPCWTVTPLYDERWYTNFFGVHLERIGERVEVLHHTDAGDVDLLGFSGPMYSTDYRLVAPGRRTSDVTNLRNWLSWQRPQLWPLPEGSYELTVTFDGNRVPQLDALRRQPKKSRALVRRWTAETICFEIRGDASDDAQEVLRTVASKCGRPALLSELQSKDYDERNWAELLLREWGDRRLLPLVKGMPHGTERFASFWNNDWRSHIVLRRWW